MIVRDATGSDMAACQAIYEHHVLTGFGMPAARQDDFDSYTVLRRGDQGFAHAAVRAADSAGTEVAGAEISGSERGPRGRWAMMLRRRSAVPAKSVPDPVQEASAETSGDENHTSVGAGGGARGGSVGTTTPD